MNKQILMRNNKWVLVACFFASLFSTVVHAQMTLPLPLPNIPATQFLITDAAYGATTSSTNNAAAIIATINAANAAGGGTVVVPAGTFLSGPITMKSNVRLFLSSGAILQMMPYGSGNGTDAGSYPNTGSMNVYANFIFGQNLSNIEISGTGTIEGNGASGWWTAYNAGLIATRPYLVRLKACNTVLVDGITLQNSPNVHLCLGQSGGSFGSNGTISNVTIKAPSTSPNTDAVDLWYWNNVDIHNCNFAVGDDNIAVDSYAQNISVKDCVFGTGHGLSVGSFTSNVNNVTADNVTFTGTTNGIRLKSGRGRGGNDSNFTYSNMTMDGVKYPFYITSWYPSELYPASSQAAAAVDSNTPIWNNVTFKNIKVTNATYGGIIYGLPEAFVNGVTFDHVSITTIAGGSGLVVDNITGLKFINCSSITCKKGNAIIPDTSHTTAAPYQADITGINLVTGASTSCNLGVNDVQKEDTGFCFPNPVKGNSFTVNAVSNIDKVIIYNLIGEKVREQKGNSSVQLIVNAEGLTAGNYIVDIVLENGKTNAVKLIKE